VKAGLSPCTKVLDAHLVEQGYRVVIHGRCYALAGPVVTIRRSRPVAGVSMMIEERRVFVWLRPGIGDGDLTGSLCEIRERC